MPPDSNPFVAFGMRAIARRYLRGIDVRVEGAEHVPRFGPALLVCRHHHHLFDGAALVASLARPVHVVVGLDWVRDRRQRTYMEMLCRLGGWPIVLRGRADGNAWGRGYHPREIRHYARAALLRSVDVLRRGELLAMFPEGYPAIDPVSPGSRIATGAFSAGYLSIALRARRSGLTVPLVPAGFAYGGSAEKPKSIVLRFGQPETIAAAPERDAVGRGLEARVRELSRDIAS